MTKYIRSKQPGIVLAHKHPSFELEFNEAPIAVPDEVADFLLKDKPDLIEEVDAKDAQNAISQTESEKAAKKTKKTLSSFKE